MEYMKCIPIHISLSTPNETVALSNILYMGDLSTSRAPLIGCRYYRDHLEIVWERSHKLFDCLHSVHKDPMVMSFH